ncbi:MULTISPECIES: SDR family oxidoreductase [Rhodopseudomonas]|uniref:Short-chain dehydrogenase n=1 Tax=Rhodopseudomonas palustris TaxID=1076 RepID=A0A0D7E0P4_RHOPL|nr:MULTISPECIES: SDR family oxidoreductase [Rhodopseudomonas]KIZ34050.1 short-chain dehydrogenase [Rhodopseudomonas palustris]MDF3808680.1 SDR family oxidoreductase [Rhodopseudomonas sp. BAL398]WOK19563.1 SDR family oxidoreductase [Rhodopseudomonas sp. BAL398]
MKIEGSVALVTGANRGIGRAYVSSLLERGARKVYATGRNLEALDIDSVERIALDITDPAQIAVAAAIAGDTTILINNAGIATNQSLVGGDLNLIRLEMETHFFGLLGMVRAFAPILERNDGGAIVNMLSLTSWFSYPGAEAYSAAKAAAWSLTNSIRLELRKQNTLVVGVQLGATDTDMMKGIHMPKNDPAVVASAALDAIEKGEWEVLADDMTRQIKSGLALDPKVLYADLVR